MTPNEVPAAVSLADIGHLLESVQRPRQRVERALVLLTRLLPADRCALLDLSLADTPSLLATPEVSEGDREALQGRLLELHQLLADGPLPDRWGHTRANHPDGMHQVAFPLVALDEVIGILRVERGGQPYDEEHLEILAVAASQLAAYLANVRFRCQEQRGVEAMQRAADLLGRIHDGLLEFDALLVCQSANPAATRLLGVPLERLVGQDIRAIPQLSEQHSLLDACKRTARERVALHVPADTGPGSHKGHTSGPERWFEFSLYPSNTGLSLFVRDVTERRAVEELRNLVIGIVGHDLRTPLGAIAMTAESLLRRGNLDSPRTAALERIKRSSARMTELVTRLLDVTRIQFAGGMPIERTAVDLGRTCHEVADEMAAAHPGLRIACDTTGDLRGHWDEDRLAQAISNLLSNAVEHGAKEEVVRLNARDAGTFVIVDVRNGGAHIPVEQIAGLFQPFQPPPSHAARRGSLGLGLVIVQGIVQAHGGAIEVRSAEAEGTTFSIRLPRAAAPNGGSPD